MTTGPAAIFGAAFVIALILLAPMRLVLGGFGLGESGLTARQVNGSMWWGSLTDAKFGDLALGDLDAGLSPIQLVVGRARVTLDGHAVAPAKSLHGGIGVSRHSFGLDDMSGGLSPGQAFAPVPVTSVDLDDVSVQFEDAKCRRAEGRVRATLAGDVGGMALAQVLSGTARCDAGALLLPLASSSGTEAIALRLWATGRFRAELTVQPTDPTMAPKLVAGGFQQVGAGYQLSIEGTF